MKDGMKYTEEQLASLTDEEREALLDVEDGDDPADGDEGQDGDDPEGEGADPADGDQGDPAEDDKDAGPNQAAADKTAKPAAKPAPADTAQTSFPQFSAPADAEARINNLEARQEQLATQFDEGEITAKEFYQEQRRLANEERLIREGLLMARMSQEAERTAFEGAVDAFLSQNAAYTPGSPAFVALDAEVRRLQTESGRAYDPSHLTTAHANLAAAFGGAPSRSTTQQPGRPARPDLPPTLGGLPAAAMNTAGEGEFAHLERLNGPAYEAALARLTPEQHDRYLARG
jgi:hypothetical protein